MTLLLAVIHAPGLTNLEHRASATRLQRALAARDVDVVGADFSRGAQVSSSFALLRSTGAD